MATVRATLRRLLFVCKAQIWDGPLRLVQSASSSGLDVIFINININIIRLFPQCQLGTRLNGRQSLAVAGQNKDKIVQTEQDRANRTRSPSESPDAIRKDRGAPGHCWRCSRRRHIERAQMSNCMRPSASAPCIRQLAVIRARPAPTACCVLRAAKRVRGSVSPAHTGSVETARGGVPLRLPIAFGLAICKSRVDAWGSCRQYRLCDQMSADALSATLMAPCMTDKPSVDYRRTLNPYYYPDETRCSMICIPQSYVRTLRIFIFKMRIIAVLFPVRC